MSRPTRARQRGFVLAVAMLACLLLSGCTAIGFKLGSVVDATENDTTRCAVARTKRGMSIRLHMRDGSQVRCRMWGLLEPDTTDYAARYAAWSPPASAAPAVPAPGERVTLSGGTRSIAGSFHGLSPAGVRVHADDKRGLRTVRFDEFKVLTDARGQALSSPRVKEALLSGVLPTGTLVVVQRERRTSSLTDMRTGPTDSLAWDDIERVKVPGSIRFAVMGGLIGLFADLVTLAVVTDTSTGYLLLTRGWVWPAGGPRR